jgi:hypothetical protein
MKSIADEAAERRKAAVEFVCASIVDYMRKEYEPMAPYNSVAWHRAIMVNRCFDAIYYAMKEFERQEEDAPK